MYFCTVDWLEEGEASQGSEEAETTDLNFSLQYRHELDSGDRTSLSLPLDEYKNLCNKLYDENRSYQRYDPAYEGFTSFQSFRAPLLDSTRFSGAERRPQLSTSNSFRSGADVLNRSFRVVKKNRELDTSKKAEFLNGKLILSQRVFPSDASRQAIAMQTCATSANKLDRLSKSRTLSMISTGSVRHVESNLEQFVCSELMVECLAILAQSSATVLHLQMLRMVEYSRSRKSLARCLRLRKKSPHQERRSALTFPTTSSHR